MFHHFSDGNKHTHAEGSITASRFADLLDRHRGAVLPAEEWLSRALAGSLPPDAACVTFDDGLRCQADIALPELEKRGLTAFWFVYSSALRRDADINFEIVRRFRTTMFPSPAAFCNAFVATAARRLDLNEALCDFTPKAYLSQFSFYTDEERTYRYLRDRVLGPQLHGDVIKALLDEYGFDAGVAADDLWLAPDDVAALSRSGHVIGLHSATHPTALAVLPVDAQASEYETNSHLIAGITGRPPTTMAHPCNSYTPETIDILERLGVAIGFCSNTARGEAAGSLEWPRLDAADIVREAA